MPVWTVLECSTAHVTPRDCEMLQQGGEVEGVLVYVAAPGDGMVVRVWTEEERGKRPEGDLSEAFWGLHRYAEQLGFGFIRLHPGADEVPGLARCTWEA